MIIDEIKKRRLLVSCFYKWCGERDLNPHSRTATSPSNLRVYHSTTSAFAAHITHRGSVVLVKQLNYELGLIRGLEPHVPCVRLL